MSKTIKMIGPTGCDGIRLFDEYGDILQGSESATPGANDPNLYSSVFSSLAAGRYRAQLMIGSQPVRAAFVNVATADGVYPAENLKPGGGATPVGVELRYAASDDGEAYNVTITEV